MRRAEITGTVLGYVIAAIIFAMILLYGYKIVFKFQNDADRITSTQLAVDLKAAVKKIGADFGTIDKRELKLPSGVTKVCFLDMIWASDPNNDPDSSSGAKQGICGSGNTDYNIGICDAWKGASSNQGENVYLLNQNDIAADPIDAGPIKLGLDDATNGYDSSPHYLCLPTINGKVEIKLRGLGDSVELSEWPT